MQKATLFRKTRLESLRQPHSTFSSSVIISLFQRIKGDQIQKQLKEENDVLSDQITALNVHIDSQEQVIKKLEERERSLQSTLVCRTATL